jgi:hypothetical protein
VKLSIQGLHSFFDLTLGLLLAASLRLTVLVRANVHVELCNLVRVLTRSWDLDRSCPVEIEVAQSKGQLLNLNSSQVGVVLRHVEVCWQDTSLVSTGWRQEEIELLA